MYFVNLSQIQIKLKEYQTAEVTALHGLRIYPDDQDLVGNVLTAQIGGGALIMAAETAKVRLANRRDVHSLSEVAELHCKYAEGIIDLDWPLAFKSLKYASALLREAKDLNPRYLPVRLKLPIALELITAYSECLDEIVAARTLALHVSDRIFLAYLYGRCLDRIRDHQSCWKFCNDWLATITELQSSKPVPRHLVVALERVRAVTLTDGYSIGVMKDGARVTVPKANSFFAGIVLDPELRLPGDFVYLGRLHGWMEKYEEANFVLAEAALLYPKYWEIPFQRASLRMQSGEIAGALELAEFATRLAPWKTQAWKQLAEVHEKLGNMTASLDALKQSQRVQQVREDLAGEIGTS